MNAPMPGSQPPRSTGLPQGRITTPRVSSAACGLLLAGAASSVFLAGGPSQGSLGIFLIFAGVALVVCPPQRKISGWIWFSAAALLGCCALAFLPESWFGIPPWRHQLEAVPAIHLPGSVTPVPWETSFWLALLGVSVLVGLLCLAHPIRSPALLVFAVLAAGSSGVYAALAIYAKRSGWHYPFDAGATFGFFPNRNHTAVLLETGSLVAIGVLGVVLRDRRWIIALVAAAALTINISALFFYSSSRGGVIFLLTGALIWVVGLGRAARDSRLLVSVAALTMGAAVLLFASGSEVRHRLFSSPEQPASTPSPVPTSPLPNALVSDRVPAVEGNVPLDFRTLIYRDTRSLIRDFPITGTGLGAFAGDFAHYRNASLTEGAALHPESDWLMLVAEAGIPAALCAGWLLALLLRRLGGQAGHPFWPLRWGCAVAAGTAMLHGLVDVPLHRVALGWWILVLAGLGLQVSGGGQRVRSPVQHSLFVLGGLAALILGGQLVRAEWFGGRSLPPFAAERAPQAIIARYDRQQAFEAMNMAGESTRVSPMAAPLYHLWGVLLLHFEDSNREVDEAFLAESLLNPNWPQVPLLQGDAWAVVDQKRAAALWLEALARKRRINQAMKSPGAPEAEVAYYRALLDRARPSPLVLTELVSGATQGPGYALAWLDAVDSKLAGQRLDSLTSNDSLLSQFSLPQRQKFLLLWDTKGDPEALGRFLAARPDWKAADWPLQLRRLEAANRQEEAVQSAATHYQISLALPSASNTQENPGAADGMPDAVTAFNRYWAEGNTVTARRVLAEASGALDTQPWASEYWRLRVALAVQDHDWPQAWQHLKRYVRQTHPDEVMP